MQPNVRVRIQVNYPSPSICTCTNCIFSKQIPRHLVRSGLRRGPAQHRSSLQSQQQPSHAQIRLRAQFVQGGRRKRPRPRNVGGHLRPNQGQAVQSGKRSRHSGMEITRSLTSCALNELINRLPKLRRRSRIAVDGGRRWRNLIADWFASAD